MALGHVDADPLGRILGLTRRGAPRRRALAVDRARLRRARLPAFVIHRGQSFVAFDAFTGALLVEPNKVRAVRLDDQERVAGSVAPAGPGLLLVPTEQGRVRRLAFREETKNGRRVDLVLGEDALLQGVGSQTPFHLISLEGRLVATTPARVLIYTWVARGD